MIIKILGGVYSTPFLISPQTSTLDLLRDRSCIDWRTLKTAATAPAGANAAIGNGVIALGRPIDRSSDQLSG
jgi:hypothetical protein